MTIFNKVSFLDKLLFTKHLSVMFKAGIPLADSLEILKNQSSNPNFKKVLAKVSSEVSNGQSLRKAMSQFPKIFDGLYLSLIDVGEESGKLEENLEYLAKELQKTYEFNQKVRNAMLYPTFIIIVALLVGGGISLFVLPQLVNLFSSLDVDLPFTTKVLLFVANAMKNYGFIIVPGLFGMVLGLKVLVSSKKVKPIWQALLLRLPIFGGFLQNVESASFCRNLGLMLKSGLSINRSLQVVHDSTENAIFQSYVKSLQKSVEKGKSMQSELESKKYPFLPPIVSKMVGVGERTGKLDETLLYLGDFFGEEVDGMAKTFPTILEPILLVIIAMMVAFVALAIISPIYQFTSSIHK